MPSQIYGTAINTVYDSNVGTVVFFNWVLLFIESVQPNISHRTRYSLCSSFTQSYGHLLKEPREAEMGGSVCESNGNGVHKAQYFL